MVAGSWRTIVAYSNFGTSSSDFREVFPNVVQKLCTYFVETHTSEEFLSCHLISLNKTPWLQPNGLGWVIRRIACKVLASVLKDNVIKYRFAGQEADIEAVIYSIYLMYEDENTNRILLVDTSNVFNSLNRQTVLHNISYLCSSIAIFSSNI